MGHISTALFGDLMIDARERVWDETRMYWPHKNHYSGKRMVPFTKAGRSRIPTEHGPMSIMYGEYVARWVTSKELVFLRLQGHA